MQRLLRPAQAGLVAILLMCVHDVGHPAPSLAAPPPAEEEISLQSLLAVPRPTHVALSPDGDQILLTTMLPSQNGLLAGQSSLWVIDVASGVAREIVTSSNRANTGIFYVGAAKWSADGRDIYWLASDGSEPQLWRYSLISEQVEQVTQAPGRVLDFSVAPDGRSIALVKGTARARRPQALDQAEAFFFSDYPEGWWNPTRTDPVDIEALDLASDETTRVASNLPYAVELSWDARGERLLFVPSILTWGCVAAAPLIWERSSGAVTEAVRPDSTLRQPTWAPDGQSLVWLEHVLYSRASRKPVAGVQFTGGLCSRVPLLRRGDLAANAIIDNGNVLADENALVSTALPIRWIAQDVFAGFWNNARSRVHAVDSQSGQRRLVTPANYHVVDYDVSSDGAHIAAILTDANTPPEVYIGNTRGGAFRRLTHMSQNLPLSGRVLPVSWRSGDDRFDVHGWLVTPPGYDPQRAYPMVVELHGGPAATVTDDFWRIHLGSNVPPAILAARGYVVLIPNPRGDPGYSADYARALVGDFMTGDVGQDILPGVDAMIAAGVADPDRIAVTGFSAGASRTAWAIGHSHRFRAASLSEGIVNFLSYFGQAMPENTGWLEFYFEGTPAERMEDYVERSPIAGVANIATPVLMRYVNRNAQMWDNSSINQGRELQASLYMRGIPTEIQIEPLALHGFRTVDAWQLWTEANLAWFDHYLLGKPYRRPRPCDVDPLLADGHDIPSSDANSADSCVLRTR